VHRRAPAAWPMGAGGGDDGCLGALVGAGADLTVPGSFG
jgi:hypothetical protein